MTKFLLFTLGILAQCLALPGNLHGELEQLPVLEPEAAWERAIAAGEQHSFLVEVPQDQVGNVFQVVAEQQQADLVLRLSSPDWQQPIVVDSPSGRYGHEHLAFRFAAGTPLVLELQVPVGGAASGGGHYRLDLQRLPASSVEQELRQRARLAQTAADQAYAEGSRSRERALLAYEQALELWRQQNAPQATARCLTNIAILRRLVGDLSGALEAADEALALWNRTESGAEVARLLNEKGFLLHRLQRDDEAVRAYGAALSSWREIADPAGEAKTRNNLGLLHHQRGELGAAQEQYRVALERFRAGGDARRAALALTNLGGVADDRGEPAEAMAYYRQAWVALEDLARPIDTARVLSNMAVVLRGIGRYQEAIDHYRRALGLQRQHGSVKGQARTLSNLGSAYLVLGQTDAAHGLLQESLVLRQQSGDRRGEAYTLNNLGDLRRLQGKEGAEAFYRRALELHRAVRDRPGECKTLTDLGALLAEDAAATDQAVTLLGQALQLARELTDPKQEVEILRRLGRLQVQQGAADSGRDLLLRALTLSREVRSSSDELGILVALALAEQTLAKQQLTTQQLAVRTLAGDEMPQQGPQETGEARTLAAQQHIEQAIALIESQRLQVLAPELRASYMAARQNAFELAVELAEDLHRGYPDAGHDHRAFSLAEQGRARALLDLLHQSRFGPAASRADLAARPGDELAALPEEDAVPLVDQRGLLLERLVLKSARYREQQRRHPDSTSSMRLGQQLEETLQQLARLEDAMRRADPRRAVVSEARPLDVAGTQALLDEQTLLLYYSLGSRQSRLFILGPESFSAFPLPPRSEIESAVQEVIAGWHIRELGQRDRRTRGGGTRDRGTRDTDRTQALAQMLLGPAAAQLGSEENGGSATPILRLALVAEGGLLALPFAALPLPGSRQLVIDRFNVVTLPSASVLATQRQLHAHRPAAKRKIAVLADPVFDSADPRLPQPEVANSRLQSAQATTPELALSRLPWSQEEALAVSRRLPAAQGLVATGTDAQLSLLLSGTLSQYSVLHFATHALVHSQRPALSGLQLSAFDQQGHRTRGFLSLSEIYSLELSAELAVLSGCRTALGQAMGGEGLWGLVQAFFHAGAARVMASLWPVEDRATAELIERFYAAFLERGLGPAEALGEAQRSLRRERRWAHPRHWAGFVLYGDWR